MRKKRFRLLREIRGERRVFEKGYEDAIDYPHWYDKEYDLLGLNDDFSGYIWVKPEDYIVINTNREE